MVLQLGQLRVVGGTGQAFSGGDEFWSTPMIYKGKLYWKINGLMTTML